MRTLSTFFFWLGNLFEKQKPLPVYTLNHPEYATMVEEAFTCGGKKFYRFKEEYRMSTGRYKYYYATLKEMDMRMSLEKQQEFINAFKKVLNPEGKKKSVINMEDLWKLIFNMESRTKLAFEPQMIKQLAAVAYFDETEDLTTFDRHYGAEKVKLWESKNLYDFFLTKPIGELFNLSNTSTESLQEYLQTSEMILKELNSDLLKVSEENS